MSEKPLTRSTPGKKKQGSPMAEPPKFADEGDLAWAAKWLEGTHGPHQGWTTTMQEALAEEFGKVRACERDAIVEWLRSQEGRIGRDARLLADECEAEEYRDG